MFSVLRILVVGVLWMAVGGAAMCTAEPGTVNRRNEWTFTSAKTYADPFNDVQLEMLVTAPDGVRVRVPAFWAGGQTWRARYSSPQVGAHRWKLECSDRTNRDLHGVEGSIELKPYAGDNPLYQHGFVKVGADHRHMEYGDGKPFFWLGDTWWMGLSARMRWPEDFQKLAADRKAKGFNVIQIVAGLYPDMHPFDPRGANEAGFPWEAEYARIRPEYFDAVDRRLEYLVDQGFTPCVVGAWGYFMPMMGVEKVNQHWRYLIARYGAMPVVWCAAGEANLPWYLAKGFPYDDRKQVTEWTDVMHMIRATDPFHRLLTIHPTGLGRLSSRHATDDVSLLDFDMLQTPHGQADAVEPTVGSVRESYADKPVMPVIDGEAAYEMLNDSLPTRWTRQMFWLCIMNGAAGHTYGANGIWQVNRAGQPHGPSPHHAAGSIGYGVIPWDEAMNLPGSTQVAFGKKLFERYEWQKFEPHADWASYADDVSKQEAGWGKWIWFDEGDPTKDAPVAERYFRKSFEVPKGSDISHAVLWISVDDQFAAYVNGELVGSRADWKSAMPIDVTRLIKAGKNVLAVKAENRPGPVNANPAGLIASLRITIDGGKGEQLVVSDASWLTTKAIATESAWMKGEFEDGQWLAAKELGVYGCAPWGKFPGNSSYGPFATGNDRVRMIYVPVRRSIRVAGLEPQGKYVARVFDPVSGRLSEPESVKADGKSAWTQSAPKEGDNEDWVLVIERER